MYTIVVQVDDGDRWTYDTVEDDHMGSTRHMYDGERTQTGFILRRSHNRDDEITRRHNRVCLK